MEPPSYGSGIDYDALDKATKALCALFIAIICTNNAILIYIIARKSRFTFSPTCLLLISLSIGDIFLALFSLVVNARMTYKQASLTFETKLSALYYQTFIISFVYGVGLVIMAVESILRHKGLTPFLKRYQIVEAFGFGALPWLLMLLIVLSLIMSDVDWEAEKVKATDEKFRAMHWVSVLVPATLAVAISLVIMFVKVEPVQENCQWSNEHILSASYLPEGQRFSTRDFLMTSHETGSPPPYSFQQPQNDIPNHHYNTPQHISATQHSNNHPTASNRMPGISATNPKAEKCALLFVAIIYFMCVVPRAALCVSDAEIPARVFLILIHSFYWLCNFRSALTPAIWILYSVNL